MRHVDRLSVHRLDEGDVHVAEHVVRRLPRVGVGKVLGRPLLQSARGRAHRHQVGELVAAVDVHDVRDRTESVGRVEVRVTLGRVPPAPVPLVVRSELDGAQIVEVAALRVQDLTQESLLRDVEDHHLGTVVVAVLHHDAVLLLRLGDLDQPPAVLERVGGRHLGRGVLAVLHRRHADRDVPLPRRRREDQVQILLGAQALEVALPAGVEGGRSATGLRHPRRRLLRALGHDVADRLDLDALDADEVADVSTALQAHSDESDADDVHGRRGEGRRGRGRETGRNPAEFHAGTEGAASGRLPGRSAGRGVGSARGQPAGGGDPDPEGAELEEIAAMEVGGLLRGVGHGFGASMWVGGLRSGKLERSASIRTDRARPGYPPSTTSCGIW